jgi:hypothetical protein
MSDVFAKRRPMIDLDEFEKRLCPPCFTEQKDRDPLTELLCITGGKDGSHGTDFEPKTQLLAKAQPDTGEPGEWEQADAQVRRVGGDFAAIEGGLLGMKQPQTAIVRGAEKSSVEYKRQNARAPLIGGDFAAIEAGLLGPLREQTTATVSEANVSSALPTVDLGAERWLYQEHRPASRHVGDADGQIRSRRPLYAMVAIGIAGMAGIAVSFGLDGRLSGPPEIESIKADNGPPTRQEDAAQAPEPSPMALDNGPERPLDSPQADEKLLPAVSQARIDNESPPAPPAPAQAPTPTEPLSPAAPVKSDAVKTDMVRPDGTLLPNGPPPQATINGGSFPAPQSPAAAKAPAAKAAGHVAKSLKSAAARHPGSHGQVTNKATATPVASLNTEPAPITNSKVEAPPTQPSPPTNGAIGFVQSAVNSLTSTTAKLLEWGRIETGSRP